ALRTMNGQKKFVQVATKVNSPSIAAAGRAAGSATCQNVRIIDAPSTRAASISSSGSVPRRYWVIQKTPNAVTMAGTITAVSSPVQPSRALTMNSGTTPSWQGTAIVSTTNTISGPSTWKRSTAHANTDSVVTITPESVTT